MPKLADKYSCTGCRSCYNVCMHEALKMEEDQEGFFFPTVDVAKCVECGLCTKSCPELQSTEGIANHSEPQIYALINDLDKRQSSSGGAFSALARQILSKGGIVYGTVIDKEGNCYHQKAETIEELVPMRGSKYIQSSVGLSYKEIKGYLLHNRWVLFTGTPCQVAGLKAYLKKDYDNLLTVDIVCHGVPSNKLFKAYITKLEQYRPCFAGISGYEFRRLDGWGKSPSVKLGGKFHPLHGIENLYMEAFDQCAIFRKSCYQCRYARIPRQGDLTIADFWGIGRHGQVFRHNSKKGVSLVMVNTELGQKFIDVLNNCMIEKRMFSEAIIENPNIYTASQKNEKRDDIVSAFLDNHKSLKEIETEFHLVDRSLKGTVKRWADKTGLFDTVKNIYDRFLAL